MRLCESHLFSLLRPVQSFLQLVLTVLVTPAMLTIKSRLPWLLQRCVSSIETQWPSGIVWRISILGEGRNDGVFFTSIRDLALVIIVIVRCHSEWCRRMSKIQIGGGMMLSSYSFGASFKYCRKRLKDIVNLWCGVHSSSACLFIPLQWGIQNPIVWCGNEWDPSGIFTDDTCEENLPLGTRK